ncbi:uncharacterized protein JCM10292_006284 [Rhodotorula paludigena]|uniref:uncharacterized protein n=1 Tax=Rhodotorula paludigena TaxID=86838 RepID=UPI00317436BD
MSIDPSLLTTAAMDDGEVEQGPLGADEFYVESILDYRLHDNEEFSLDRSSWPNKKRRYELRYFVKWQGYGDDENSWEPRDNFAVAAQAKRQNDEWLRDEKQWAKAAAKKVVGDVLTGKGKGKGKGKQKETEADKAPAKGKGKGKGKAKEKTQSRERKDSVASASPAPGTSGARPPKAPRQTRNSRLVDSTIDQDAYNEFLATNAPKGLSGLRFTPPPKHDADGNLIVSSDYSGSPEPTLQQQIVLNASQALGFAGSDDEDDEMAGFGASGAVTRTEEHDYTTQDGDQPHLVPLVQPPELPSFPTQLGFADDSDEDDDVQPAAPGSAPAAAAQHGFADDSDDDADADYTAGGAYFPSLTASRPPSAAPAPPAPAKQANGFAGSSDDEPEEDSSTSFTRPHPASLAEAIAAVPISAGLSDEGIDAVAPVQPSGFAESEEDEEAGPAPMQQVQPMQGFADEDDEDEAMPAPAPEVAAAAPVAPPQPTAVQAGGAAPGFGDDEDSEPELPLAQSVKARPTAKPASRTASVEPTPAPAVQSTKTGQTPAVPHNKASTSSAPSATKPRPHKRPSQDDHQVASDKPAKVSKVVTKTTFVDASAAGKKSKAASPTLPRRPPPKPVGQKRTSSDILPTSKKRRVVHDDEEEEADMSPPVLTQAQQLAKLKIRRVGEVPPPRKPSTTSVAQSPTSPDRSRQSPTVSNETSSHGSGAQAKRAHDPFNQGVARPTTVGGFVKLNGDLLANKKLPSLLTRGETVRYPPEVISDVDKIRFLWSVGLGSDPLNGVEHFDDDMYFEGRAREAFVVLPPDEARAGVDKRARAQVNDYQALQLLLTSVPGVKQADSVRDSVRAVFVHVNELATLGKFPSEPIKLQLDHLRINEDIAFYVYGQGDDGKRELRRFWRPFTAFTFTPSAFIQAPGALTNLCIKAPRAHDSCLRSQFPWVPLQYLLPGSTLGAPVDTEGRALHRQMEPLPDRRYAKVVLHSLLLQDQLPLAALAPSRPPSTSSTSLVFPMHKDQAPYNPSVWEQLAEVYPSKHRQIGLEELQHLACAWRAEYPQIRRWLIIATQDEIDNVGTRLPGFYLKDVHEAAGLLDFES